MQWISKEVLVPGSGGGGAEGRLVLITAWCLSLDLIPHPSKWMSVLWVVALPCNSVLQMRKMHLLWVELSAQFLEWAQIAPSYAESHACPIWGE